MEIVKYLFTEFLRENISESVLLLLLSLFANILHTNVITYFNSAVITSVQERTFDKVVIFFKYLSSFSCSTTRYSFKLPSNYFFI